MLNIFEIYTHLKQGHLPPLHLVPEPLLDATASLCSLRGKMSKLTSLERILATLYHKKPDRVPVTPLLGSGARQIKGISFPDFSLNPDTASQVFIDGYEFIGGDMVILLLDLSMEAHDFGQKLTYPEKSTAMPDDNHRAIKTVDDYEKLKPIDLAQAKRMQAFIELCRLTVKRIGLRGVVTGFVFGPIGILSMMRGAEALFKDCILYPRKVKKACETITEVLIPFVQAQCETGIGGIAIDTLFASANGLPKPLWEELEGPFVREISRAIKSKGLISGIHNCGHQCYFDVQIRYMEPEVISFAHLPDDCSSPRELKEKYGDQVTLMGHIPTPLLINGSPYQVQEACRAQIEDYARDGGYILAPGCEYPPNIALTNALAIVKAAKKYG